MRKLLNWLGQALVAAVLATLFSIMFIEWAAGCGESYVDSKGVTHANECIIIK